MKRISSSFRLTLGLLFAFSLSAQAENPAPAQQTQAYIGHDIRSLSQWGPYSKKYYGISHIEDLSSGVQVEFFLIPGQYRRNFKLPCCLFESGVHPWQVSPDLRHICFRHDIEWKDQVYVDALWHRLDESRILLEAHCVNHTSQPQNINLQLAVRKSGGKEGEWTPAFRTGNAADGKAPARAAGPQEMTLRYPGLESNYGVAWNFPYSEIREWNCARLEDLMPYYTHNHTSRRFKGDFKGHYTVNFLRPVELKAGQDTTLLQLLVCGPAEKVDSLLQAFHRPGEDLRLLASARQEMAACCRQDDNPYAFGKQLLEATLLTNVVYPIDAFGSPIRHFCPGKNWNSLYTWDCGFIGWAMSEIDAGRGYEIIRQYTTAPEEEAPFVHHGTPLAIQIMAIGDVWERGGCDQAQLQEIYPRLKRFYDYMTGPRFRKASGLLETWNIFYNSGGWDDYPPQWALRPQKELRARTTPMVSTSYYIRCAKILRMLAAHLQKSDKDRERVKGYKKDLQQLDRDIQAMSKGILDNAWDERTGYFGYVHHDENGKATGIYQWTPEIGIPAQSGTRPYVPKAGEGGEGFHWPHFNMGLDGVTPLVAGITTPGQEQVLLDHLFTLGRLWSDCGITAVDQTAPYYRPDGYWSGTVWLPHQMILWKTMLDKGRADLAEKIARTALDNWERECEDSYNCYEHFMIDSGRGGGWNNFSGLSSPIINWYNAYYTPGTVSTGFGTLVTKAEWAADQSSVTLQLEFDKYLVGKEVSVLARLSDRLVEKKVKAASKPLSLRIE